MSVDYKFLTSFNVWFYSSNASGASRISQGELFGIIFAENCIKMRNWNVRCARVARPIDPPKQNKIFLFFCTGFELHCILGDFFGQLLFCLIHYMLNRYVRTYFAFMEMGCTSLSVQFQSHTVFQKKMAKTIG